MTDCSSTQTACGFYWNNCFLCENEHEMKIEDSMTSGAFLFVPNVNCLVNKAKRIFYKFACIISCLGFVCPL